MNQGKDIKVHVTGGDSWQERELVADTIATTMRDRGFNNVGALNSVGEESQLRKVMPRTVFEAVKVVSPTLIERNITIDPGYDETHPDATGIRTGSFRDVPNTGMSVYDPNHRPNVGSRWASERLSQDSDRIPGIHTAARTVGTNYGAILDVRNSDRPGKLIEAIEKEFDEEVVHVGIIAETTTSALRAVEQALMAQPNAHVTVSLTENVLPGLMDTKNSDFFHDRPREITVGSYSPTLSAIESEMRRYGNPETFSVKPQGDGLVSVSMQPRTKAQDDKLYGELITAPQPGGYTGLVNNNYEDGWLTKDDFGNPLNTDPNHEKIVQMVAKEAAENARQRADEHLANARRSIEQAKKLGEPGLQEEVTQMVKTNMQASGGYDDMSDSAVEELASVAVAKGFQNAKNKLAAQRGEYVPPVEDDVEAETKKVKERTKIATKRVKERTAP